VGIISAQRIPSLNVLISHQQDWKDFEAVSERASKRAYFDYLPISLKRMIIFNP
jgi:hypothetical protein